ncbi:TniQ family protein [Bordetella genomosp. 11]|uniref:TniQ domain-containing protein n=1 Tax=Bordetella genomosp. 11 TaxID=1416808 RepID=A0A261UYG1_9BORD|nr:hypothetical protein CAL28_02995 [Bordetella genomosp. 11]
MPEADGIRDDESGNGYALRMAERNGLPFGALADLVASAGHRYIPAEAAKYVGYLFGARPQDVHRAIPQRIRRQGATALAFMGCALKRPYLVRYTRPQVCALCLRDIGYARAYWDLALATACTDHRCCLIERCPNCSRALSWRRPGLRLCWCGADLADCPSDLVGGAELAFNLCLREKLSGRPSLSMFDALSLDTSMRLIRSIGICDLMPGRRPVPGKVTRALSTESARAVVQIGMVRWMSCLRGTKLKTDEIWDIQGLLRDAESAEQSYLTQAMAVGPDENLAGPTSNHCQLLFPLR